MQLPQYCSSPEFLTVKPTHTPPPAIRQNDHVRIPPCLWLHWVLILLLTRSQFQFCGFACPSSLWGVNWPFNLSSLMSPRKAIDFSVFSSFSYKEMSYDFQSLYMLTLKLEVSFYNIKIGFLQSSIMVNFLCQLDWIKGVPR